MSNIIHLYEAGRLPVSVEGLTIAALQHAGIRTLMIRSLVRDPATVVVCVPPHVVTVAGRIISELCRRRVPIVQDAYTGGHCGHGPGAGEAVQNA